MSLKEENLTLAYSYQGSLRQPRDCTSWLQLQKIVCSTLGMALSEGWRNATS